MSNPSLKEQLKALSLELSTTTKQVKRDKQPQQSQRIAPKTLEKKRPAWLEQVRYGVEMLKAYFPECFKELNEIRPLKIGIKQDLVKALSAYENISVADKACMVSSLSYYVNSPAYHKTVIEGAERIDLTGQSAGIVSAAEAHYSLERRQMQLQKKKMQQKVKVAAEAHK